MKFFPGPEGRIRFLGGNLKGRIQGYEWGWIFSIYYVRPTQFQHTYETRLLIDQTNL